MRLLRAVLLPALAVVLALVGLVAPASAKAKPWKVTATPDRVSTTPGVPVTVTGKVKPKAAKKKVRLQVSTGGAWSDVASVKTTKKSRFALSWAPTTYGSYTLRVTKGAGAGHKAGSSAAFVVNVPTPAPPVVSAIDGGSQFQCAQLTDGSVKCWGGNAKGELGRATSGTGDFKPGLVAGLIGASSLTASGSHTCVIVSGVVKCWGDNTNGQLNLPTSTTKSITPVAIALPQAAIAVSAGVKHTCAVLADRTVSCWGTLFANANPSSPATVAGLTSVASVSAGNGFTCAVTTTGAAKCWGLNDSGQLGTGNTTFSTTPQPVLNLGSGVESISAGYVFACAVKQPGGLVYCWGTDADGEVGNGSTTGNVTTPTYVMPGQASVTTGSIHACSRNAATGRISCWGDNGNQDLGVTASSSADIVAPTPIESTLVAVPVSAAFSRCALDNDHAVWCWGDNFQGELGRSAPSTSNTPAVVAGLP